MPRMSKKRKHELSFYLNDRGRVTYNELCRKCQHGCKQKMCIRDRHMIIFDVKSGDCAWGDKGERMRLFLNDAGYGKAKEFQEQGKIDRKSTRLNSSHLKLSRMPSSA